MDSAGVITDIKDHVGIVRLARPEKHNAMNDAMSDVYREAVDWAIETDEVRCILLCAEGKSFCTGRDVSVLGHRARDESDFHFVRRAQETRIRLLDCPKPVITAIQGYALGGGCEIALCADIRIGADDAVFALPEINYGLLPDTGGTQYVTQLAGPGVAKYMVMSGARVGSEQAYRWGLIDFLVKRDTLDEFALEMARSIASKPPLNLAMAKQLVDNLHGEAVRRGIRDELVAQTALFKTDDYSEARAAHMQKRRPVYRGK